jgi:hypothetical protein
MFAARVQDDMQTQRHVYARNPEAQQFYFKGVKDVLASIAAIKDETNDDPHTLALVLEALYAEVNALPATTRVQ